MIKNSHDNNKQTTMNNLNDTKSGMNDAAEQVGSTASWDCDNGVCVLQWKPQKVEGTT